jgi:hypothetical protein
MQDRRPNAFTPTGAATCFEGCFFANLIAFTTVGTALGAQISSTTGSLLGTVRDVSGAAIQGGEISARSVDTNQTLHTSSAMNGTYRFPALPVGDYAVRVDVRGFIPYVKPGCDDRLGAKCRPRRYPDTRRTNGSGRRHRSATTNRSNCNRHDCLHRS